MFSTFSIKPNERIAHYKTYYLSLYFWGMKVTHKKWTLDKGMKFRSEWPILLHGNMLIAFRNTEIWIQTYKIWRTK